MSEILKWGILGCGSIARTFARGLAKSGTGKLMAVGSRELDKARKFGIEFGVRGVGSYEALIGDKEVEAIYIATPHPMHAHLAIWAMEAGKHVLVEKPMGVNSAQGTAMVEAARTRDVFLMEAFMYRCHPQTKRVAELVRQGAIGEVRGIEAGFSFATGVNPESRLFRNDLAGGGILDVGGYPVSFCRLIAGAANGKDFLEPLEVKAMGHLGETGVDEWAMALLKFPGDLVAQVATGVCLNMENGVRIYGTKGRIFVGSPWIPARDGGTVKFTMDRYGNGGGVSEETITCETPLYTLEADVVARNLERREAREMGWEDSLGNLKALDVWRAGIGLTYEMEKLENFRPVHGRALKVRNEGKGTVGYGEVPFVGKKVSRLVMGVDNWTGAAGAVVWDDYFERGGNAFDTAYIYGGGHCERALGKWVKTRGIRKEVVILGKGGHTPWCTPEGIDRQILESLERMGVEYLDLYALHRDNLEIGVGELMDALNRHVSAGRVRAIGASNWTLGRVEEANVWARERGLRGFSMVSNNFSLARMVDAPWGGCISSSDLESRKWFEKTGMALMPWSSQAQGFFVEGRHEAGKNLGTEVARSWYCEDNFERMRRAQEVGKKYGVAATAVALAYVLGQKFLTFPLIGPRQLSETRSSWEGLKLTLSEGEMRWLNLEE